MAARFEALDKLRNKLMETHHDYRVAADIFPSLNVDKIASDMGLVDLGSARGGQDQPSSSSKVFDEIEHSVVERVQDEKKAAHQTLEDQLHLLSGRIANLGFEEQFGLLQQITTSSLSDFKGEIAVGLDTLHARRTDLHEATKELIDFRKKHRLERVARLQKGTSHFLRVALLVFLFLFETYVNGSFLAKGNDQGFLGGATEAFAFSFVNIGSALILAIFCVRLVTHRSFTVKLFGIGSILLYAVIALGINLLLAHYREVSGTLADGAGSIAIQRMRHNPLGLEEVRSWMLFLVGLIFSIIAFIDGWFVLDPYPGYAGAEKRRRDRRDHYTNTKSDLIDRLIELRDTYNSKFDDVLKGLGGRRREHAAILASRARLLALFNEHQDQLERCCNLLLSKYREANIRARKTPPPKHFSQPFKLQKSKPVVYSDGEMRDTDLSSSIAAAQQALGEQMRELGKECEAGIEKYRDLDKLYPETLDGQAQ
ncbi:nicotinamide mononucleotide transporter [Mesorhizobium sp. B3-1-3]|uniref:nicotinamide mononucleotide transporter n=1 Tax=unclassified Mesorhizobium TaxID=325217 RepID=UPI00112967CC|nr:MULTISPECIES: nicotinamide mononucleotide transporter [unclassified Mesorhizobium]TPI62525.1 nicotinamide mononucleotide transporter [Mesorhizobium sp. B3-1-8]TPI74094.1 nicotinamide mononucleotide transporter [Mesorhizobium sp. B3-1-3]